MSANPYNLYISIFVTDYISQWGEGNGWVGGLLKGQAWEPEFNPRCLHFQKWANNPMAGKTETGDWETCCPARLAELTKFKFHERSCLKNEGRRWQEDAELQPLVSTCKHKSMKLHTQNAIGNVRSLHFFSNVLIIKICKNNFSNSWQGFLKFSCLLLIFSHLTLRISCLFQKSCVVIKFIL